MEAILTATIDSVLACKVIKPAEFERLARTQKRQRTILGTLIRSVRGKIAA